MLLPKLAGGKRNSNGTFWREQISPHVILIAELQSRSLAPVACQLITTLVSFPALETLNQPLRGGLGSLFLQLKEAAKRC